MAYDRYDSPRDSDLRGSDRDRGNREDRGFFERAGDEIASWFGDDDAERRRREDEQHQRMQGGDDSWGQGRDYDRGYGRSYDRDRRAFSQSDRSRDYDRPSSRPMNWTSSDHDYRYSSQRSGRDEGRMGSGYGSSRSGYSSNYAGADRDRNRDRNYRPMAGDYGRSDTQWGRDDYRNTSYAGSGRDSDRHYSAWRQRQMDHLDRDYDNYCREKQDRFENDFGSWRQNRMSKRQQLGQVREHMDVVGSDGEDVGKVDCVRGDHIVLTKSDSDDNRHHSIECSMVDTVEGDQVRLNMPAEEAKSRFKNLDKGIRGNDRDERTNLERSFSGTYEN